MTEGGSSANKERCEAKVSQTATARRQTKQPTASIGEGFHLPKNGCDCSVERRGKGASDLLWEVPSVPCGSLPIGVPFQLVSGF